MRVPHEQSSSIPAATRGASRLGLWYNLVPAVAEKREARRYFVTGIVQGVGFRFFAERVAEQLGIAGFVRNRYDSRVEVYAIGTLEQLHALRAELERGPRGASVERVEEETARLEPRYADGFTIEYNA